MNPLLTGLFAGLFFLLGLQVDVVGEKSATDLRNGHTDRLLYAFATQSSEQRERARRLPDLAFAAGGHLHVVGVVRDLDLREGEGEALRRELAYPLLDLEQALGDPAIPERFRAHLESSADWLMLIDRHGRPVKAAPGAEMEELLATLKPVSTDVDESTWGKIKELFQ